MTDTPRGFTLVRTFDATPKQIWAAWTDPAAAARWLHPQGLETPGETFRIDAKVGGRYAYTMVNDETGERYPTGGVYREVVPFERLVFTWGDPEDDPDEAPLVTITLRSGGDLTRMTFDLRGVDGMRGDGSFYDGWEHALDSLAQYLGQSAVHG